jgi:hypothetical protein
MSRATSNSETRPNASGDSASRGALKLWGGTSGQPLDAKSYLRVSNSELLTDAIVEGTYLLEAYARAGAFPPGMFWIYAEVTTPEGAEIYRIECLSSDDWAKISLEFPVPANATQIDIGLHCDGVIGQSAWIQADDFSLAYIG